MDYESRQHPVPVAQQLACGRDPRHCVLAAGLTSDINAIRRWCAALPGDTFGQVFIEAEHAAAMAQLAELEVPAGVSVTVLSPTSTHETTQAGSCTALRNAVDAWLNEWYLAQHGPERRFTIYMGAKQNTLMCAYWRELAGTVANT